MRTILATGTALTLALTACGTTTEEPIAPAPQPSAAEPALSAGVTTSVDGSAATGAAASGQGAGLDEIMAGERAILIHLAGVDRDLSATYEGPITTGDGTDDGALFRLMPVRGGQYLIEALRAREEGGRWCVIVDDRATPRTLGTEECAEHGKSRFALVAAGGVDDKNRPTHHLINDAFGAVRHSGEHLVVDQSGTADPVSFVDRGAA